MKIKIVICKGIFIPLLILYFNNCIKAQHTDLTKFKSGEYESTIKTKPHFKSDTILSTEKVIFYIKDDQKYILYYKEGVVEIYKNGKNIHKYKNRLYYSDSLNYNKIYLETNHYFFAKKITFNTTDYKISFLSDQKDSIYIIDYDDENDFTNIKEEIYIDKERKINTKYITYVDYLKSTQYKEIKFNNIKVYDYINQEIKDSIDNTFDKFYAQYVKQPKQEKVKIDTVRLKQAVDFSLKNLNGDTINLFSIKSRLVLLDFWYVSCYPCTKAIPHLVNLTNKYNKKDLEIIGINDHDDIEKIKKINKRLKINYEILLQGNEIAKKYKVYGFPKLFLIDTKTKEIIHIYNGYSDNLGTDLEKIISDYLKYH